MLKIQEIESARDIIVCRYERGFGMRNQTDNKIRLLYFSGLYPVPDNKRGIPFIDNRFNIIKKNQLSTNIFFLLQKDAAILSLLKKILIKKYKKNDFSDGLDFWYKSNWYPLIYTNNMILSFANLMFKRLKIRYLSKKIEERIINMDNYDLAHVHWAYPTGVIFNEIKRKRGIPYVLTLHGTDIHNLSNRSKVIQRLTIDALEKADKCIFVSEQLKKIAQGLHYSGKNAVVIPNGFNPDLFYYTNKKEAKKVMGFTSGKVVGFVGNLIEVKNVLLLPDIFKAIKEQYSNVEFVVIGDGELRSAIEGLFKEKNITVKMTGNISQLNVANYMRAMDILVLPSKNEGWPCVIKEAHACGTYVVGSDRGGIPEAIGHSGKTFDLNNQFIKICSDHILEVLNMGYDVEELIKSSNDYTWENVVQKEISVYREILEGKKD